MDEEQTHRSAYPASNALELPLASDASWNHEPQLSFHQLLCPHLGCTAPSVVVLTSASCVIDRNFLGHIHSDCRNRLLHTNHGTITTHSLNMQHLLVTSFQHQIHLETAHCRRQSCDFLLVLYKNTN